MPQAVSFSTVGLPPARRIELWEDHNAAALIGLRCQMLGESPLEATELNLQLEQMHLARVRGNPHVVERPAELIRSQPSDAIAVYLTLVGEAFFYHSGGLLTLRPGQALICDADRPFMRGFSGGLEELAIKVPRPLFRELTGRAELNTPVVRDFAGGDVATRTLARLADRALRPSAGEPVDEAIALDLLVTVLGGRPREAAPVHLANARAFIEEHLTDPGLSAARVAAAVGISERHLSRAFAAAGPSLPQFVLSTGSTGRASCSPPSRGPRWPRSRRGAGSGRPRGSRKRSGPGSGAAHRRTAGRPEPAGPLVLLDVLQVLQQARVLRLPAERLPGVGAGRGLVGREDRAERAVGLRRHRLDRQAQPAADDRGDVAHLRRPRRPPRARRCRPAPAPGPAGTGPPRRARARPASAGCRRPGSRRPRSGGRCRSAGRRTRPLPWLWTVRGMRTAVLRTPREARPRTAVTARPRPPTGPSVGSGSASVETRPGTQGVPETVTKGRSLPTSSSPRVGEGGALLGDRLRQGLGAAEVVAEGQVDHPVGLGGAGAQDVQVGEGAPERLGAGRLGGQRGRVGAGEREDGVAVAEQLGDDGGPDQAGAAGDEDAHGNSPRK